MPGDSTATPASWPASEGGPVQCPVHRVDITPCDTAELAPLLTHLSENQSADGARRFPRGTLLDDGRLDLCKQSLGTDNCLHVAHALQRNTHVRSLMLGTNAIGDAGAGAVAGLLASNERLEVLYLGCNNIGPQGADLLARALGDDERVTGLWLKRNPLGPQGVRSMADMLRSNRHLRVLDLVNTDLRDDGVQALVDALCTDNRHLGSLYLSGNGLGPAAAQHLARLLRDAPQVKALYLSVNRLGDPGAQALADALMDNHTLQTLELASNGIGPEGAKALFAAAKRHAGLQVLHLGHAPSTKVLGAKTNCIGDEGVGHAAELLASSTVLRRLDLVRNGITAAGVAMLAEAMQHNERLTDLGLDTSLPEAILTRLARNREVHGDMPLGEDQALIRSVYR